MPGSRRCRAGGRGCRQATGLETLGPASAARIQTCHPALGESLRWATVSASAVTPCRRRSAGSHRGQHELGGPSSSRRPAARSRAIGSGGGLVRSRRGAPRGAADRGAAPMICQHGSFVTRWASSTTRTNGAASARQWPAPAGCASPPEAARAAASWPPGGRCGDALEGSDEVVEEEQWVVVGLSACSQAKGRWLSRPTARGSPSCRTRRVPRRRATAPSGRQLLEELLAGHELEEELRRPQAGFDQMGAERRPDAIGCPARAARGLARLAPPLPLVTADEAAPVSYTHCST